MKEERKKERKYSGMIFFFFPNWELPIVYYDLKEKTMNTNNLIKKNERKKEKVV